MKLADWEFRRGIDAGKEAHGRRLSHEPFRTLAAMAKALIHEGLEPAFAIQRALNNVASEEHSLYTTALGGALEHAIRHRRPTQREAMSDAA